MSFEQDQPLLPVDDVLFLDLEANGLTPDTIWCVACKYRGEVNVFRDSERFHAYLRSISPAAWIGHNALSYDFPVLENLWGTRVSWMAYDSLVLSRLASPSRDGGHSLRAWGERLASSKLDYDGGWDAWSQEMEDYCVQDVEVLELLYKQMRKELRGFDERSIKLEHDVAKIIDGQVRHGWTFDTRGGEILLAQLKEKVMELSDEVHETFKPLPTFVKVIEPKVKADGTLSIVGLKFLGDRWTEVGGTFSRIDWPQFNLGSRQQIGRYLQRFGWKPRKLTPTGQPMVDEKILSEVKGIAEASLIAEYLMVQKRVAMVQSWLDAVQEDGRVHGRVRSNGAVTGRMTHDSPNVAQVPSSHAPWGGECRSLWTVPEGFSLVGCDASSLELRMLAHYMGDEDFTKAVVEGKQEDGTDVHTRNQRLAGLETRNQAKTFIYAFLYGAGDAKIGAIVGGNKKDGRELKDRFLRNTPSLSRLRERVTQAAGRGYLRGLDGRKLQVRSEHAALNTLLQGAGAIVMKDALVVLNEFATKWNLCYNFVGNIHDEWQVEVRQSHAEKFGFLAVSSIQRAGINFNLKCPLDGDFQIGTTWEETH